MARALLMALAGWGAHALGAVPETINLTGAVSSPQGAPLTGNRAWVVQFYGSDQGGTALGDPLRGIATLSSTGAFNVALVPPAEALNAATVYYSIGIDTDTPPDGNADDDLFGGRLQWHSVPFALQATTVTGPVAVAQLAQGQVNEQEFGRLAGVNGNIQQQFNAQGAALTALADEVQTHSTLLGQQADHLTQLDGILGAHAAQLSSQTLALQNHTTSLTVQANRLGQLELTQAQQATALGGLATTQQTDGSRLSVLEGATGALQTDVAQLTQTQTLHGDRLSRAENGLTTHAAAIAAQATVLTSHAVTLVDHAISLTNHSGAITTLQSQVATLQQTDTSASGSIAALQSDVATHTLTLAQHSTQLALAEQALTTHTAAIASHGTTITAHTDALNQHDARLTLAELDLTTHAAAIAGNSGDIATNAAAIASHGTTITAHTDALNQHDSRLTLAELGLTTHAAAIAGNSGDIAINAVAIASHGTTITAHTDALNQHDSRLTLAELGLTTHAAAIAGNSGDIAINAAAIASHGTTITAHTVTLNQHDARLTLAELDLTTHAAAIAGNSEDIAINTAAIASHGTTITAHTDALNQHDSRLTLAELGLTTHAAAIAGNSGDIATNTAAIASHGTTITAHTDALNQHDSRLTLAELGLTTHAAAIAGNSGDIATNTAAIASHGTTITAHTVALNQHDSRLALAELGLTTHAAAIAGSSEDIAINTAAIASHGTTITAHTDALNQHDARLTLAELDLTTHAAAIAGNSGDIATNAAAIASHGTTITAHTDELNQQGARLTLAELGLTTHAIALANHSAQIADLDTAIAGRIKFADVYTSTAADTRFVHQTGDALSGPLTAPQVQATTLTATSVLELAATASPDDPTQRLYNLGGNLYWNGTQLDAAPITAFDKNQLNNAGTLGFIWNDSEVGDNLTISDWSKVSKTGSSLADLATRSAGDLNSGTLNPAWFSAYTDLTAEGYLDNSAAGDLLTQAQGDGRYLTSYTETDTLASVTTRGASTSQTLTLGAGMRVDTIAEKTSAAGVTIEGSHLKGGKLGVGVSGPQEKLDVGGPMRLQRGSAPSPTTDRLYNDASGDLYWNGVKLNNSALAINKDQINNLNTLGFTWSDAEVANNLTISDWTKISKAGSSLADLESRSASDLSVGALNPALFSAYTDLTAEGYLDNTVGTDLLTRSQADARYIGVSASIPMTDCLTVCDSTLNATSGNRVTWIMTAPKAGKINRVETYCRLADDATVDVRINGGSILTAPVGFSSDTLLTGNINTSAQSFAAGAQLSIYATAGAATTSQWRINLELVYN